MRSLCTRLAALVTALVGFVVVSPGAAWSEVGGVHLNLNPYVGFATWGRGVNLQDKLIYGGRVGLGLGKRFEIEGTYGKSSTDTQAGNGTAPWVQSVVGPTAEAKFTHLAGDLLFNIVPDATIDPYIFGGYGSHKIEIGASDEKYSGLNIGGGLWGLYIRSASAWLTSSIRSGARWTRQS